MPTCRFSPVILTLCGIGLALTGCLKQSPSEPLDQYCARSLATAHKNLETHRNKLDKREIEQSENALNAAKIEQERENFAACADKAQRAISFLEQIGKRPPPALNDSKK